MYLIYLFVYGYSVHMTKVKPEEKHWGYICCLIFLIIFVWTVSLITKKDRK